MKVRCTRILQGGRRGADEVGQSSVIHVGGEYVVLAFGVDPIGGAQYRVLDDESDYDTGVYTVEMFEIISAKIANTWTIQEPYGSAKTIVMQPEAWADPAYGQGREAGSHEAVELFRREIAKMYEEEDEPYPRHGG